MAKTKLKTGARKTTISRNAVREVVTGKSGSASSLSKKHLKAATSKKK